MEFAIPQNIAVDTVTATWKTALASYRKSILKDDFQEIQQSTGPQDILNYIESVKRDGQARNVSKTFSAIKACMDRLHRFGGALDILAQGFSQPGCLLWGSIKFALTVLLSIQFSIIVFNKTLISTFRQDVNLYFRLFMETLKSWKNSCERWYSLAIVSRELNCTQRPS